MISKLIEKLRLLFLKLFKLDGKLNNLTKKLEELQRENENCKEIISSYNAKFINLQNEINQLKNEVENYKEKLALIQKENANYKEVISSYNAQVINLKKDIEQLSEENEAYRKFINFFKNLSNGKRIIIEADDKTKKISNFALEKFIPNLAKMNLFEYTSLKELETNCKRIVNNASKYWLKDNVIIAFAGKFSAGKSSVINSLLETDLLPVDCTPTTATPTYICFSPEAELIIKVADLEDTLREIPIEFFKEIKHDLFKGFPFGLILKYSIIKYNHSLLKNVTILDTPGFDSVNAQDMEKTMKAIDDSSAVFWVLDINDGTLKKDTIEFIKSAIQNKPFYVIINKADKKSPKEREQVKQQIEKDLKRENIPYKECILYSSKNKYESLFKPGLIRILQDISQLNRSSDNVCLKSLIKNYFMEAFNKISDEIRKSQNDVRIYEEYRNMLQKLNHEFENIVYK